MPFRTQRRHLIQVLPLPADPEFLDAPFVPEPQIPADFTDPMTGITISTEMISKDVNDFNNTFALVTVTLGPEIMPCNYGPPQAVFNPPNSVDVNATDKMLNFSVTIVNGDSKYCPGVPIGAYFSNVPPSWGNEANQLLSTTAFMTGNETKTFAKSINLSMADPGVTVLQLNLINLYTGLSSTAGDFTVTVMGR